MRVLIPSDNKDFVAELVLGYQNAGCDVVTGSFNFDLGSADFDLIHYQWPEEFCGWKCPSEQRLQEIITRLQWWEKRCATIVTAHNLYPHGHHGNSACKSLCNAFYETCSWILHFSQASKKLICNEFTGARHDRHLVTSGWNFDRTLRNQQERGSCRGEFGFADGDLVVLILGALRTWDEIKLVTRGFSGCRFPHKKLLMAGRYVEECAPLLRRWRQGRWKFWLRRQRAAMVERFIPDEELYKYLDSADVVLVPRLCALNSGIPSLAMTFSKMVIAPSIGAFPEMLAGTNNLLFDPSDPSNLARALDKSASLDRKKIGAENRLLADQWGWDKIVSTCLNAVKNDPQPVPAG